MNMESISQVPPGVPRPQGSEARRSRAATPTAQPAVRVALPDDAALAAQDAAAQEAARNHSENLENLKARVEAEAARFEALNQSLSFRVHDGTGELMVQVVDRNTGDVLRETPPKEFLDLAVRLQEMVGFFLDETR